MVDYEIGVPAWDIGQIMTRHQAREKGDLHTCSRIASLQRNKQLDPRERLRQALTEECDCGAGDSDSEHTTERREAGLSIRQGEQR